jgi:hypothetical protein
MVGLDRYDHQEAGIAIWPEEGARAIIIRERPLAQGKVFVCM